MLVLCMIHTEPPKVRTWVHRGEGERLGQEGWVWVWVVHVGFAESVVMGRISTECYEFGIASRRVPRLPTGSNQ